MLFGMALATPLAVGMVGASTFGIWQAVRFRHPALVVLSIVTIVCGGGLIALLPYTPGWNGGPDSPMVDYGMGVAFGSPTSSYLRGGLSTAGGATEARLREPSRV
jgi:hypothetical protein